MYFIARYIPNASIIYPLPVLARCGLQETLYNANVAIPIIKLQPSSYSKFINELFSPLRGEKNKNEREGNNKCNGLSLSTRLEYYYNTSVASTNPSDVKEKGAYVHTDSCTHRWISCATCHEENGNNRVSYCYDVKFYSIKPWSVLLLRHCQFIEASIIGFHHGLRQEKKNWNKRDIPENWNIRILLLESK